MASVASLSLQHQVTNLHFQYAPTIKTNKTPLDSSSTIDNTKSSNEHYDNCSDGGRWFCYGKSCLYVITEDSPISLSSSSSTSQQLQHQLALHLRGSCTVVDVKVEAINVVSYSSGSAGGSPSTTAATGSSFGTRNSSNNNKQLRLLPVRTSYHHVDPLKHVLIKPPSTFDNASTNKNNNNKNSSDDPENTNTSVVSAQPSSSSTSSSPPVTNLSTTITTDKNSSPNNKKNSGTKGSTPSPATGTDNNITVGKGGTSINSNAATDEPASELNNDNSSKEDTTTSETSSYRFGADSQSSRGAVGMTTSLRAASIASSLGELRINVTTSVKNNNTNASKGGTIENKDDESQQQQQLNDYNAALLIWKNDMLQNSIGSSAVQGSSIKTKASGIIQRRIQTKLEKRSVDSRTARIDLIAQRMAVASGYNNRNTKSTATGTSSGDTSSSSPTANNRAFKITIQYKIPFENCHQRFQQNYHFGGIHAVTTNQTPHVYTTCGIYGDHEGSRCWVPCCDTASAKSRCTHCITIKVTAPALEGISVVGCGDDYGCTESILHEPLFLYTTATDSIANTTTTTTTMTTRKRKVTDENTPFHENLPPSFTKMTSSSSSSSSLTSIVNLFQEQLGMDHVDFLQRVEKENPTTIRASFANNDGYSGVLLSSARVVEQHHNNKEPSPHLMEPTLSKTRSALALPPQPAPAATLTFDTLHATSIWCSHVWTPVPIRSIGFAIGPFKIIEDPEYFGPNSIEPDDDDDDDDEDDDDDVFDNDDNENNSQNNNSAVDVHLDSNGNGTNNKVSSDDVDTTMGTVVPDSRGKKKKRKAFGSRLDAFIQSARRNGEGIRQVFIAPIYERKFIHTSSNSYLDVEIGTSENFSSIILPATDNKLQVPSPLLPHSQIRLTPLTLKQREMSELIVDCIKFATTGVPHRALSLMRDTLAVPTYRTSSYTQIWIPHAVHGGTTSGALHNCPECYLNSFVGGAILDSSLLPPPMIYARLPYYNGGGRVLQFVQARCAIRGWITAAIPLGGYDDVGMGYLLTLIESLLMSIYERGHGGFGEGGGKGSMFYSKRYAASSGLNSTNLDFLPVQNIEEIDMTLGGLGAVPVEERHNEQLWRGTSNGSESHTSAMDEFNVRQVLCKDVVDTLERQTDKDKDVPSPSMGWFGSHLSLSLLSSNATSSSDIGCGAVDLLHPVGGVVYRALKCDLFRGVVEGRAGIANFIRLVRATFVAAHLEDIGEKELKLPQRKKKPDKTHPNEPTSSIVKIDDEPHVPFIVCVNEIIKKKGLQYTLFTRVLQNLCGRIKEAQLAGTLVDIDRYAEDPRTRRPFVEPEGFPNSYVRGASMFYLKVGVYVETTRDVASQIAKGIQMQAYAEPIVPKGGIAFGGPITIRVVENEGSFREYVKDIVADGSRRDWGATFLHAKPVTTTKAQTIASSETTSKHANKMTDGSLNKASTFGAPVISTAFTETNFHAGASKQLN